MRILPVVLNNYSKNAFKGLHKSESNQYSGGWDTTGYDEENTYIYYYPFKDETQEEIDKFMKSHPNTSNVNDYYKAGYNPPPLVTLGCIYNSYTILEDELPFTKEEYENYKKLSGRAVLEGLLSFTEKELENYNKMKEILIKRGL